MSAQPFHPQTLRRISRFLVERADTSNKPASGTAEQIMHSENADEILCVICLVLTPDTVLLECGHAALCCGCATRLWEQETAARRCPLCRDQVRGVLRILSEAQGAVRRTSRTPFLSIAPLLSSCPIIPSRSATHRPFRPRRSPSRRFYPVGQAPHSSPRAQTNPRPDRHRRHRRRRRSRRRSRPCSTTRGSGADAAAIAPRNGPKAREFSGEAWR